MKTNERLTSNGLHQQKQGVQATTENEYKAKLDTTLYFLTHRYKVVRGHNRETCTNSNDGHMEIKPELTPWEKSQIIVDGQKKQRDMLISKENLYVITAVIS